MSTQAMEKARPTAALDAARERAGFGANKLTGVSMKDLTELADAAVASGMFADVKNAGIAKMKILAGREVGLEPIAALQAIHFFNNRVVYGAGVYTGLMLDSNKYDYQILEHTHEKCVIQFFRRNGEKMEPSGPPVEYNKEDAKRAGLSGKDVYTKFGDDMYFAGAIRKGFRRHCNDLLRSPSQRMTDRNASEVEYLAPANFDSNDLTELEGRVSELCKELNARGDSTKWSADTLNDHINTLLSTEIGVNALANRETYNALISSLEARLAGLPPLEMPDEPSFAVDNDLSGEVAATDDASESEEVHEATSVVDIEKSKHEELLDKAKERYLELDKETRKGIDEWLGQRLMKDLSIEELAQFLESHPA